MMPAPRAAPGASLRDLLAGEADLPPALDRTIGGIRSDSREIEPGDLFVARRGERVDATRHAADAAGRGAVAIVVAGTASPALDEHGLVRVEVADLEGLTGRVAHRFFARPSERLAVIAVTGTNGKTSVSHFVAEAIERHAGRPVGILGTLGGGLSGSLRESGLTTPDCVSVHRALAGFVADGAATAVMEASSHALVQRRLEGVRIDTAVFTNLSRDHLDYHGDMRDYARAKARLFAVPGLRGAVVNAADPASAEMRAALGAGIPVLDFALGDAPAAIRGRVLESGIHGTTLQVETPHGQVRIASTLIGEPAAWNLLASLATLILRDIPAAEAAALLERASAVPGRMQALGGGAAPLVVIDYAHTPAALAAALGALRPLCAGRLWCVFGAGGERDPGKRPAMGEAAALGADVVIVTDDNPRGEDGDRIVAAILSGVPAGGGIPTQVERDRARAIARAVAQAAPGDVVLIAGKGHESYQDVGGERRPFSDVAAARAALAGRAS